MHQLPVIKVIYPAPVCLSFFFPDSLTGLRCSFWISNYNFHKTGGREMIIIKIWRIGRVSVRPQMCGALEWSDTGHRPVRCKWSWMCSSLLACRMDDIERWTWQQINNSVRERYMNGPDERTWKGTGRLMFPFMRSVVRCRSTTITFLERAVSAGFASLSFLSPP